MPLTQEVDVTCTRYNIRIGTKPYSVYEYKTDNETYLDYVLRDGNGKKLKEFSEEYILVGKTFVDTTPD